LLLHDGLQLLQSIIHLSANHSLSRLSRLPNVLAESLSLCQEVIFLVLDLIGFRSNLGEREAICLLSELIIDFNPTATSDISARLWLLCLTAEHTK